MTANELADKQAFELGELSMLTRNETAAMLRQQQAEIESLKDKLMLVKQSLEIVEGWVKK